MSSNNQPANPFNQIINVVGGLGDAVAKAVTDAMPKGEDISLRPVIVHELPAPLIDPAEERDLVVLDERFQRIQKPGMLAKAGGALGEMVPKEIKDAVADAADSIKAQELYRQALEVIAQGYTVVEQQASKFTLDEKAVLNEINKGITGFRVTRLEEIALLRSYELAKVVNNQKGGHLISAFLEGAVTGVPGFAGLPFNLVLSTFLFYRAVQCIAMYYGYDVKNDPAELIIAGEVFASSLMPSGSRSGGVGAAVGKVMIFAEATTVKQTVKKGWVAMAAHGGVPLAITQMRALANGAAKKALEKAGKKGLENSVFKSVFKQIGGKMSQKVVGKAVPIVGGAVGALFDAGQMNSILEYADLFYHKRFILEKGYRVNRLLGIVDDECGCIVEECPQSD